MVDKDIDIFKPRQYIKSQSVTLLEQDFLETAP